MSRFFISSLTMPDMTRHRRLLNYLQLYWRHSGVINEFSTLSNLILSILPQLSFVPAFLQIYTGCRYNELFQISVGDLKSFRPLQIKSSKSKHIKTVPPLISFRPKLLNSVDIRTSVCVISYDKYKNDIIKAKIKSNIQTPFKILDCTHIFRHIEASFMAEKGIDLSDISSYLGHGSDKTTLSYIHDTKLFYPKKSSKKG